MAPALRRDSGSVRADSAFLRLRTSFVEAVRTAAKTFDDSAFQILVWPEGARGWQRANYQRRLGLPLDPIDNATADSVIGFLKARGIWAARGEGRTYFSVSEPALLTSLGRFLTPPMQEYLGLLALEQANPTGADASLLISWDELAERVARTDRFPALYPDAVARDLVRVQHLGYLRWYLRGADNTEVFRRGTRELEAHVRENYERYAATHGSMPSGQLVRAYLEVLRANNYRDGLPVVEFLRKNSGLSDHELPLPRRSGK
jgi:hypothetical protein